MLVLVLQLMLTFAASESATRIIHALPDYDYITLMTTSCASRKPWSSSRIPILMSGRSVIYALVRPVPRVFLAWQADGIRIQPVRAAQYPRHELCTHNGGELYVSYGF